MGPFSTLGITPGYHADIRHVDPRLLDSVSAGASYLPAGYKVTINGGYTTLGHARNSQHHIAGRGALDVQIWDPHGRPILNKGHDTTGMYTALAKGAYASMLARHPELKGHFAWGGSFGTIPGGHVPDLMHFDIGGERGGLMPHLSALGAAAAPSRPYSSNPDAPMVAAAGMTSTPPAPEPGAGLSSPLVPAAPGGPMAAITGGAGNFGGMGGGGGMSTGINMSPANLDAPTGQLEAALQAGQANQQARAAMDGLVPVVEQTSTSGKPFQDLFGTPGFDAGAAPGGVMQQILARPKLADLSGGVRYRA